MVSDSKKTAKHAGLLTSLSGISLYAMFNPEAASRLLNEAWQTTLAQALIFVTIIWFTMGKKVAAAAARIKDEILAQFAGHFKKLDDSVTQVAREVADLGARVGQELSVQKEMIGETRQDVSTLKTSVTELTTRVGALESPGEGNNGR